MTLGHPQQFFFSIKHLPAWLPIVSALRRQFPVLILIFFDRFSLRFCQHFMNRRFVSKVILSTVLRVFIRKSETKSITFLADSPFYTVSKSCSVIAGSITKENCARGSCTIILSYFLCQTESLLVRRQFPVRTRHKTTSAMPFFLGLNV